MKNEYFTMISAIVAALAGSKLWDWLQKRSELAQKREESDESRLIQYRDDLRDRVAKLEAIIDSQQNERIALLQQIGQLTAELAAMKVKLEFLERENSMLRDKLRSEGLSDEPTK